MKSMMDFSKHDFSISSDDHLRIASGNLTKEEQFIVELVDSVSDEYIKYLKSYDVLGRINIVGNHFVGLSKKLVIKNHRDNKTTHISIGIADKELSIIVLPYFELLEKNKHHFNADSDPDFIEKAAECTIKMI